MSQKPIIVEKGIVAGNVYDKYKTSNPIARYLMSGFLSAVTELIQLADTSEIHEVGCGEGELSIHLASLGKRVRGSDFSTLIIEQARQSAARASITEEDLSFKVADIYSLKPEVDSAPCVVCCEVLEHLEKPEEALGILVGLARPFLLLSVPREPIWRILNMARGKYLSHLGNTPGHLNAWSKRGFLRLINRHLEVVAVRSPLPWTMVLCRARVTQS